MSPKKTITGAEIGQKETTRASHGPIVGAKGRTMSNIFDLESSEDFFGSVLRVYDGYQRSNEKNIEDLLYVLMGLTHLREWIAPRYNPKDLPSKPEQDFSKEIYDLPSFTIVRFLCNRTKHMEKVIATASSHDIPFDEWIDFDAVRNFDLGPVSRYLVDGRDVKEIIDDVIAFYRDKWFERK